MNWSCGMPNVAPRDGICKPTGWHMQADEPPFGSRHGHAENATWAAHAEWWFIKRKSQRHDFDRPKFVNKEGKDYLCSSRVAASYPIPCRGEPRHNWPTTGIYIPCLLQKPIKQHLYGLYKRIYRFRLRHPLPVGRSAQQEDDGGLYHLCQRGKCHHCMWQYLLRQEVTMHCRTDGRRQKKPIFSISPIRTKSSRWSTHYDTFALNVSAMPYSCAILALGLPHAQRISIAKNLTCLSVRKRLFLHQVISNTTMSNNF